MQFILIYIIYIFFWIIYTTLLLRIVNMLLE